jgi:hypothetical protein
MAVISSRVYGDGTSVLMRLQNEEFIRQFSWLNGWQRLRIGVLWSVQGSGTFTLNNAGVGIASSASPFSATLGFKSSSCKNAMIQAVSLDDVYSPTSYVYNAGGGIPYYSMTFTGASRKVGATWAGGGGNGTQYFMAVAGAARGFFFADFWKSGLSGMGGYSYLPTSAALAQTNWTMNDIYYGCQQANMDSLILRGTTITRTAGGQGDSSALETAGVYDCLSIWWDNAAVPLEIYGIAAFGVPLTS